MQAQLFAWVPPSGGCGARARAASPPARLSSSSLLAGWLEAGTRGGARSNGATDPARARRRESSRRTGELPLCGAELPAGRASQRRRSKESTRRTGEALHNGERGAELPAGRESSGAKNPPSATRCAANAAWGSGQLLLQAALLSWGLVRLPRSPAQQQALHHCPTLLRGQPAGDFLTLTGFVDP